MRQRTANCLVRDRVTASEAARGRALAVMAAVLAVFATGCVPLETSGLVRVDGSSTVYPIQEAVAEAWLDERGGRGEGELAEHGVHPFRHSAGVAAAPPLPWASGP